MFGYSEEEVIGKNIKMLMPELYHSERDDYWARYLKTGEKRNVGIGREVIAQRKDGTIFPVERSVDMKAKNVPVVPGGIASRTICRGRA